MVSHLKDKHNVEAIAVCDLWKDNRERAAASTEKSYGRAAEGLPVPRRDLLAQKDVDAVVIATPEHSHSPLLKAAADAGKHAYCEKPMGNVLGEVKAARDAVKERGLVVQIGTQHRSEPYQLAAREVLRSGALGDISKYEIVWNFNGPRWRGRPQVKQIREQDTDWKKWLMTKPDRPFDPQLYFEFRLYKEFSSGIPDQWMSHGIDLVHFFMNEQPPRSIMAQGGVFAWHDGRENPDTFEALVEYPTFLVSYSTSFGNDCDSFSRIMGKKATLVNIGGEGSPRWKVVEERGNHEDNPTDRARRALGDASRATTSRGRSISATRTCRICRTGSSACVTGIRIRTPPWTTAFCTRWRASWPRSRIGRGSVCTTIPTAEQITDIPPRRS